MVNSSIKHLVDIALEDMYGSLMCIVQHPDFSLVKVVLFRVYSIPDKSLPVLSSEISKGEGSSEVVVGQHF